MLTIPAIVSLLSYVYWRPHEIFELFRPMPSTAVLVFAIFGFGLDVWIGAQRPRGSPLLVIMLALVSWCIITVAVKAPDRLGVQLPQLATSMVVFFTLSEGLQSLRALGVVATILLVFTLTLAGLGIQQGLSPPMCYVRGAGHAVRPGDTDLPDGRLCEDRMECIEGGLRDVDYLCERPGLLGTHSIAGRVRFRGLLEDPNELSWALAMGLPLSFALYERRRTAFRLGVLGVTLIGSGICVVMTQSRGGQLGMLTTLGVYFIRRFRWMGAIPALALGVPILLLGGRSDGGADQSTQERLEAWAEGFVMWRENPFVGVGAGQFVEHHVRTAHNSYMLILAELGPIGFMLWTGAIYFAFKIAIRAQIELAGRKEAAVASSWAAALMASLVGLAVSALFLSLSYHTILWAFLGLAGGLYTCIRTHDPTFRVRFGWRDVGYIFMGDAVFIVALAFYLRLKGY